MLAIGAPAHSQHPTGVSLECVLRSARVCVPDAGSVVTASGGQAARRNWGELAGEDRLAVAWDAMRQARDGVDFEDGLGLCTESDCCPGWLLV